MKQQNQHKGEKRHRRTKAELLQDPEYCRKHGIKPSKTEPAPAAKGKKAVKESVKRHRRTKAELLQDPEYCKKHGIGAASEPAPAPKEKKSRKKASLEEQMYQAGSSFLTKAWCLFEKIQSEISVLETELCSILHCSQTQLAQRCLEFRDLDIAAGKFSDAFTAYESAIAKRRCWNAN